MEIPELMTARLRLRGFGPGDVEPYIAMMADAEVTRHLGAGHPLSREDAWRQLAMVAGHWVLRGFGLWAVEDRETGKLIGRIGCFEPDGWPGFEIGYVLARPAWGRGYAREGASAALAYARETLGKTSIISLIRPENEGSIRVATALGAVPDGEIAFYGGPALVYRYPGEIGVRLELRRRSPEGSGAST
ncbi:MAG TPA: GNAT family N-acetyltransferase [Gemmatimonadaceae bacterium]|nr:GNAT family N-acetyltransferase [Gemmatimonadaceae bacterium]